jgi:hypothetical protein
MIKQKVFKDKPRIKSNSGKLTGWLTSGTSEQPVVINEDSKEPIVIREEDADELINLADIPEAGGITKPASDSGQGKRRRGAMQENTVHEVSDSDDSDDSFRLGTAPARKRSKRIEVDADEDEDEHEENDDGKKKLALNTSYEGFSIYGRILCLVVKRKGVRSQAGGVGVSASSQQMMEQWVSTQAAAEQIDDDEYNG